MVTMAKNGHISPALIKKKKNAKKRTCVTKHMEYTKGQVRYKIFKRI